MNRQGKLINGKVEGGIEWCKTVLEDGTERQGFTLNAMGGCLHGCRWIMPDQQVAECYAETTAEGVAAQAYPEGFEKYYWHPEKLKEPGREKEPARIFIDSMSDAWGAWVPDADLRALLEMCRRFDWHTYLSLTKNAPRALKYLDVIPPNMHIGFSSPPDIFMGKVLSVQQKTAMLRTALSIARQIQTARPDLVTWMSFEPLSWNMARVVNEFPTALKWAVVGAASRGKMYYQPDAQDVQSLLDVLDAFGVPVFFKGNLSWKPWREEYPRQRNHANKE